MKSKTKSGKGKKQAKAAEGPPAADNKNIEERYRQRRQNQEARYQAREQKRRLEEESQRLPIIPPKQLTKKQLLWIRRNCQPKIRRVPIYRPCYITTPWAKKGPMTAKDWKRFYQWADKNAEAKKLPKPSKPPEEPKLKKKRPSHEEITADELLQDIGKLAMPKKPRGKYVPPPREKFTYSPKIHWDEPPKHDRGRPFKPPKVPDEFQHIELEIEFWSTLRFPIRPTALTYQPSANILGLAQPRITPPIEPHCPIPKKPKEYVEPRKRMSKRRWEEHQQRLLYLARPVCRPIMELDYY